MSETPVEPAVATPPAEQVPAYSGEPVPVPVPAPALARPRHTGRMFVIALLVVVLSGVAGGAAGYFAAGFSGRNTVTTTTVGVPLSMNASDEPVAAAAAVALPSVVNIDVTGGTTLDGLPSGHPGVPSGGTGSGIAYKAAPDGGTYILTNDHVVSGATKIVVTPASGDQVTATLVGTDPQTDIAVVKVPIALPLITIGDSDGIVVGQTVVAIGSPFGFQHSVSSGVISALHRSITTGSSTDTTTSAYPLVDVVQTDAAINPGNSGGALVDRLGRLLGINSAIYTDSGSSAGVGFAIPSKTAVRIADELIAGGKATHPFLGVEGMTVSDAEATAAGLPKAEGAIIQSVIADTGAARAGLKKGDIVTALDGQPIRTMDDLILAVRRAQVGDQVTLTVWRDKASISVIMTVGDKPATLN
ncbi:MAG TPA: trypsin-like peptidase domain-containing protein [Coriobacteriia bacterium]